MSRSSNLQENPAVKTLKFKGEKFDKKTKKITREAGWFYWDKNGNDGEGEDVTVSLPLTFLWLESAQSFTGYNDKKEQGVYSNEILPTQDAVKKYGEQELTVKCGTDVIAQGKYKDIKEEVKGMGGKFCIPVYAAWENQGEYEIIRLLMTGASGSAWMSFNDRNKNLTNVVVCYDTEDIDMKTGDSYKAPMFKYIKATDEQLDIANELVKQVDSYFDYLYAEPVKTEAADY